MKETETPLRNWLSHGHPELSELNVLLSRYEAERGKHGPAFFSGSGDDPRVFLEQIQHLGFQLNRIDEESRIVPMEIDELMLLDFCELYLNR